MTIEKHNLTVEEVEERISDIQNYYLKLSRKNKDKKMIRHWQDKLTQYEHMLKILKNSQG